MLIITLLVTFGLYVNEKNRMIVSPLKTSVHYLQVETTEVHLWIQKMLEGQVKSDIEYVWFQLELSVTNFREILEGGDNNLDLAIPNELANELKIHLKGLDSDIAGYKAAVSWLLNPKAKPGTTPPNGLDYEHSYAAILARLDGMESPIDLFLQKDLLFFRKLLAGGVITCFLLTVLIATTFSRFLKQKADDYNALDAALGKYKNEAKERNLAEEAMRQSHNLFRAVFETSPDAVVVTRIADNIIIDVNHAFTTYTGYDKGDVVGRSVLDIEIWQDIKQRKALLDEVSSKGFAINREAVFCTRAGGLITGLLSTNKIDINGEPHLLTVARDITDRKLYETRIQEANKCLVIGNRHTEMQPLLRDFVAEIKIVSGCSAAAVRILDEGGRIPHAASDGFDADFCSLKEPLSVHSHKGMCARVINNQIEPHASLFTKYGSYYVNSTSEFLSTASVDQTRLMRNTCHRFGYESLALIPIRSGDRAIGLIHVADREVNRLTDNKIEMLEGAALQLGTAIERVRAEQALKDSHDELEKRVEKRTEMLLRAKDELLIEVEERKKYEQELLGYQQRLRHLSSELLQTEERERRRIAMGIHDHIGQTLAMTKIQLGALQTEYDSRDLKKKVEDIRDLITQTIRYTRALTFDLSPPVLYELGLQAALEWLAEIVRKQSGLMVKVAGDGSDRKLDTERRVILFRICRELLLNVVKHAAARRAQVSLRGDDATIMVKISDDGTGFDPTMLQAGYDPFESGFGLFSIREQLRQYGGTFEVDSNPGHGSGVTISVPLSMTTEARKEVSL